MPLDPVTRAAFINAVGAIADRLLNSEADNLKAQSWLGRRVFPYVLPWISSAIRRALGNALDKLATTAESATSAQWVAAAMNAGTSLLTPAHAALAAARFGDPL